MPNQELAVRTKKARIRAGFTKEKDAAAAIGCSRPLVIRWEAGEAHSIGGKYLMEAARVYRVRPEWLALTSDDDGYPWEPDGERVKVHAYEVRGVDGEDGVDAEREVMIAVSDIEVSGGPGVIVPEYVETKYRLPFQIEWLRQFGAKPEQVRIARVRGSSMEPTLWDGDKAVIHTGQRRIRNDRVFALIYGGEARVKRISMMADGRLRIVSDNPDKTRYPDEYVQPEDMAQVYIIGQVIDRSGGGGL
ncbi:LexA family transcriptional regulator [Lysobacter olei]